MHLVIQAERSSLFCLLEIQGLCISYRQHVSYVGCADLPIMEVHGHGHRCLWYNVFTYHIGRVVCKECFMSDEYTFNNLPTYCSRNKEIHLLENKFPQI